MPAFAQTHPAPGRLEHGDDAPQGRLSLRQVVPLAALTALMACPALAWELGGLWAAAPMLVTCVALTWRLRAILGITAPEVDVDAGDLLPASRTDATRLAVQVVPVWQRNVDAARDHSERSMAQLLESFSGVAGHLDRALTNAQSGLQLDLGAVDQLLDQQKEQVDALAAVTRTATGLLRDLSREAFGFSTALDEMAQLTREVQNIGRATHLLALNTSVEANRAGGSGGGFMVVATEVRELAAKSREAGSALARHVSTMQATLADLERRYKRENIEDEDEVDLKCEQAARSVVLGVLSSMGSVTQTSRELRQAGHEVQSDLEKIFIGLQSQDRLSQMLTAVTSDMARYGAWLGGAVDPEAQTPARWLDRLESTYPMEEMRSSHHGTAVVQQDSTVEFF